MGRIRVALEERFFGALDARFSSAALAWRRRYWWQDDPAPQRAGIWRYNSVLPLCSARGRALRSCGSRGRTAASTTNGYPCRRCARGHQRPARCPISICTVLCSACRSRSGQRLRRFRRVGPICAHHYRIWRTGKHGSGETSTQDRACLVRQCGTPKGRRTVDRLAALLPLLNIDATFVSLQKDVRPTDAAVLDQRGDMLQFGGALGDFADTAD